MEPITFELLRLYSQRQWIVLMLVPVVLQTISQRVNHIRTKKSKMLTKLYLAGKITRFFSKCRVKQDMMVFKRRNNYKRSKR